MKPRFASIIGLVLMCGVTLLSTQAVPQVTNSPVVAGTKHNLSISGPGGIKSTTETEVCVFCHVPHNANNAAPLWNRPSPTGLYTPYWSTTTKGGINGTNKMGLPNGTSLLCLSCHDGTIALGNLVSRSVAMSAGNDKLTSTNSPGGYLGTDLSDDHPISFVYSGALATANGELVTPVNNALTGQVKLDASSQLQCSSCHDPHNNQFGKFLVMDNKASALCVTCHTKSGWAASSHATSTKPISPVWPRTSATTVAGNACESCHRPHTAGGNQRLLNGATDDVTCFTCHSANSVAGTDIKTVNLKSGHNVTKPGYSAAHDPSGASEAATRHVVCSDCHNPHQANNVTAGTTTAASGFFPILPSTLKGVKGIDKSGSATLTDVKYEYEVCFKCHGASTNRPGPTITRAIPEGDFSKKFQPSPPGSFHPVVAPNSSANGTSLIAPLTAGSTITCSACHNNDLGTNAGGAGPKGPHGSTISSLLERTNVTSENTTESATNYALCYKCHSRASITGNGSSSFSFHSLHIKSPINAPCSACHDPHGVTTNKHLINFDTTIVSGPTSGGPPTYTSTGVAAGSCNLVCHTQNKNHSNWKYP
jgi:predicted CXXCH cytochrome family protein